MKLDPGAVPFAGQATYRLGTLRIEGTARYPNQFSTAALVPVSDAPVPADMRAFRLVFNRDKEPFCDTHLVGPVVYVEHGRALGRVKAVRVFVDAERFEDVPVQRWWQRLRRRPD